MFIKWIGMGCILFSSLAMGAYMSGRFFFRAEDLAAMRRAMMILKNQILFYSMPLPDGMKEISQKIGGNIGNIFASAANQMEQRQGRDAQSIWQDALEKEKGKTYFVLEDMEELHNFGRTLGYLDKCQQQSAIELLIRYLEEKEQQLRKAGQNHTKLYGSMSILIAMLTIVVLL